MKAKIKKIQESLLAQLKARNADTDAFVNLVADYCFFAEQLEAMKKDIKDRGLVIDTVSAAGKEYERENPSVASALKYSQQMLKIIGQLGLSIDTVITEASDEDSDL